MYRRRCARRRRRRGSRRLVRRSALAARSDSPAARRTPGHRAGTRPVTSRSPPPQPLQHIHTRAQPPLNVTCSRWMPIPFLFLIYSFLLFCRYLFFYTPFLPISSIHSPSRIQLRGLCMRTPVPSVLWRCWLGDRKGIRPVKTERWGAGVVICLKRSADLHMAQLMPLPLTVSCFSKIQIGFTFLVPAHHG